MWIERPPPEVLSDVTKVIDFSEIGVKSIPLGHISGSQSVHNGNMDDRFAGVKLSRCQVCCFFRVLRQLMPRLKRGSDATPSGVIFAYPGCCTIKALDQAL
jgi:hypothetical protein